MIKFPFTAKRLGSCLSIVSFVGVPELALAQTSPFMTGASALQTNILSWLTPCGHHSRDGIGCYGNGESHFLGLVHGGDLRDGYLRGRIRVLRTRPGPGMEPTK